MAVAESKHNKELITELKKVGWLLRQAFMAATAEDGPPKKKNKHPLPKSVEQQRRVSAAAHVEQLQRISTLEAELVVLRARFEAPHEQMEKELNNQVTTLKEEDFVNASDEDGSETIQDVLARLESIVGLQSVKLFVRQVATLGWLPY